MSDGVAARVAHVAITVPDLDAAVAWYERALGLRTLPRQVVSSAAERPRLRATLDETFGRDCEELRVAFLVDDDSVAIELFEFNLGAGFEPPTGWDYGRAGISHLGFLVTDVDAAAERVLAAGGRRRSRTMAAGGDGAWRFCYCEDPWGTVIELQTHTQEEMYGAA